MGERVPVSAGRPASAAEAAALCASLYFEPAEIRPLEGEYDASFRVADGSGRRSVLKISPSGVALRELELQVGALLGLEGLGRDTVPRLVPSKHGNTLETAVVAGEERFVRLQTYLEGVPMVTLESRPSSLMEELGAFLARLDLDLEELAGTER